MMACAGQEVGRVDAELPVGDAKPARPPDEQQQRRLRAGQGECRVVVGYENIALVDRGTARVAGVAQGDDLVRRRRSGGGDHQCRGGETVKRAAESLVNGTPVAPKRGNAVLNSVLGHLSLLPRANEMKRKSFVLNRSNNMAGARERV
jgi:hypothetical protein